MGIENMHSFAGIVGKPQLSGILNWNIVWKKEELKMRKLRMKIFNSLSKIATACNI